MRATVAEKVITSIREPFNTEEIYRYLDAKRVQLVQAVEVSLSSIPQLIASGPAAPQTPEVLELHLIVNLTTHSSTTTSSCR